MEAEEERKRQEAEEAERARLAELEKDFDKHGELTKYGGNVFDFFPQDSKFNPSLTRFNSCEEILALQLANPSLLQKRREGE